ncbi:hypothetical protein AB6A40_011629 [Gnathostoma spinigerum]|uniref:Uncharacterized protein n=1 Tax=Gnathostoma spinigerum TaxID=75299 RepID=A0ABD6EY90_9BILA
MEGSGQTVGAVVFSQTNNESTARHQPSAISHSHSSLSRLATAMPTHMLDDLVEELEDISPSAKNSFIEKDAKNDLPQQMEAISESTNFVVGGTRRSPEGETSRTPLEAPQEGKQ